MILEGLRRKIVGERRALALLSLGALITLFVLVALAQGGAWATCFLALALTYGVAFFAIGSEWFWGRWFAVGLATSGLTMAGLGLITSGWNVGLLVWGAFHGAIYLPLLGGEMSERYEMQTEWRERYNLDDAAVLRIKRAVHSAATALPTLIFYTLAPRDGQGLAIFALAAVGIYGLLRMRVWGVMVLAGTALWTGISALTLEPSVQLSYDWLAMPQMVLGLISAAALAWAVTPFAGPIWRKLKSRV